MKKFLKGNGWYLPADNIRGIDTGTDTAVDVWFDAVATGGAVTTSKLDISVAGSEVNVAESLIEEINFGKKVVIDCESNGFHPEVDGAATYTESTAS